MRAHFRHLCSKIFSMINEFFNPMGLEPCNRFLQVQESIGTPTPKVGAHLGVWGFIPSHSLTFPGAWDVTPELPSWSAPLQALALVVSPRLGLRQYTRRYNQNKNLLKVIENFKTYLFKYVMAMKNSTRPCNVSNNMESTKMCEDTLSFRTCWIYGIHAYILWLPSQKKTTCPKRNFKSRSYRRKFSNFSFSNI